MTRIVARPVWGAYVLFDPETGEYSFQCLCGGAALYFQRVLLTPDEAAQVGAGTFDGDQMVRDVCKQTARVKDRFVPTFQGEDFDALFDPKP